MPRLSFVLNPYQINLNKIHIVLGSLAGEQYAKVEFCLESITTQLKSVFAQLDSGY